MNTTSIARQATAFGLAAALTFTLLASINLLATRPSPVDQMAASQGPVQVVVVTGKRLRA